MLPKALKTCPKSNKSPNLVTLVAGLSLDPKFSTKYNICHIVQVLRFTIRKVLPSIRQNFAVVTFLTGAEAVITQWIRLRLPSCIGISSTPSMLLYLVKFCAIIDIVLRKGQK